MSLFLFAIVVDVVTENARKGLMKEVLYADDFEIEKCIGEQGTESES